MATLREVKKRTFIDVKKILLIVIAAMLCISSMTHAFDGNRKGFVLGGGLGFSPSSGWSGTAYNLTTSQYVDTSESRAGFGFNLLLGHGWNEKNILGFEFNMSKWKSDVYVNKPDIWQGFVGMVWYHFFNSTSKSLFTATGMGMYRILRFASSTFEQDLGAAFLFGAGYEFLPHWLFGVYFGAGRIAGQKEDHSYHNLNFLITALAF